MGYQGYGKIQVQAGYTSKIQAGYPKDTHAEGEGEGIFASVRI